MSSAQLNPEALDVPDWVDNFCTGATLPFWGRDSFSISVQHRVGIKWHPTGATLGGGREGLSGTDVVVQPGPRLYQRCPLSIKKKKKTSGHKAEGTTPSIAWRRRERERRRKRKRSTIFVLRGREKGAIVNYPSDQRWNCFKLRQH